MSDFSTLIDQFELPPAMTLLGAVKNLLIAAILGSILGWFYTRFGRTLTNRASLARVIPFVALTTVLVITVVQSSLALALGLIGALSIVRFRTPIKEPEELAYLFTAIGIGLGLGANQPALTLAGFGVIMGFLIITARFRGQNEPQYLFLNVDVETAGDEVTLDSIQRIIAADLRIADLRRLDSDKGSLHATYYISSPSLDSVLRAMENLRRKLPHASISLIDRRQNLGV